MPTKYIRRIEEKKSNEHGGQMNHENMTTGAMNHDNKTMDMGGTTDGQSRLFTHSAHLFVLDKDAQARRLAHTGTPVNELVTDIRSLIVE